MDKYNNPSEFSKYAKLQRQLNLLEKKIAEVSGTSSDELNLGGIFGKIVDQTKSQFSYFNNICFFLQVFFKMFFIYYINDKIFYFKEYEINNKPNILFEYLRDTEGYINFQIRYIFIAIWIVLF